MQISERARRIPPFQVMELVKRARLLEAGGADVIHLSIGEPDFTAAAPVVAALEHAARTGLSGYTPALGITPLREAIARHYHDAWHVDVDPSRIVVTAGASAALNLICAALVNPGDGVLVTDPSYPCNRHFISAAGGVPQPVAVDASTRFQADAQAIARRWQGDTRGVLLATPANPTGTSIDPATLAAILDEVRARGGFSIIDEIYLDLSYPSAIEHRSALSLADDVIVVNSFSKFFSMTGWRLGWLVLPPALVPVVERLAQNLYICASALAQHAALACFTPQAQAIHAERRESFRQRRDWLVPALSDIGLPCPVAPDGAFYAWVDCRSTGWTSDELSARLLTDTHVAVVPGADFGANAPEAHVRLSYATALPSLQTAVERIGNWLASNARD